MTNWTCQVAQAEQEANRENLEVDLLLEHRIEELELAYETLPHPNVLYNIGRAYAEAGRYQDALEYFERYLASTPEGLHEQMQTVGRHYLG